MLQWSKYCKYCSWTCSRQFAGTVFQTLQSKSLLGLLEEAFWFLIQKTSSVQFIHPLSIKLQYIYFFFLTQVPVGWDQHEYYIFTKMPLKELHNVVKAIMPENIKYSLIYWFHYSQNRKGLNSVFRTWWTKDVTM